MTSCCYKTSYSRCLSTSTVEHTVAHLYLAHDDAQEARKTPDFNFITLACVFRKKERKCCVRNFPSHLCIQSTIKDRRVYLIEESETKSVNLSSAGHGVVRHREVECTRGYVHV